VSDFRLPLDMAEAIEMAKGTIAHNHEARYEVTLARAVLDLVAENERLRAAGSSHIMRVAALADAMPIDEDADRMVGEMMARHRANMPPGRKLVDPKSRDERIASLESQLTALHTALTKANEDRDIAWESRDAEVAAKLRLVGAVRQEADTRITALKAALVEACDIADELGYGHGDIPAHRRIATLRAIAEEP
jgi:hypothetical protein